MKKIICLILSLLFLLGAFFGCTKNPDENLLPESTEDESTEKATQNKPNNNTEVIKPEFDVFDDPEQMPSTVEIENVRVQLLSDTLVRIEMKGYKGFENRASLNVVNRVNWEKIPYTMQKGNGETVINTEKYSVHIPDGLSENPDGAYIVDKNGNEIWKYIGNPDTNVYLPSPSDELKSWYFNDGPRVIPSKNGYTPLGGTSRTNGWDLGNDATDLYVFLPDGSYETFVKDYISLTGPSEMVTLNMLGYWDSRYYAYSAETALQQIKDYQEKGYSIDVLVIDTDWRKSNGTNGIGYEINKELFPDMAAFLEEAHKLGVTVTFNDHPEPVKGTDSLLSKNEVEYRNKNIKLMLDRNWTTSLKPIANGISIYATGMYAYQWMTEDYYESITDVDEYARRALIMANVDGIQNGTLKYAPEVSSHRYSIQWTGDIGISSEDIADEIFNSVYGGAVMGLPYVSADIGGHFDYDSRGDREDVYARWMQFGALSPICRVHCNVTMGGRMPWLFGKTAEDISHTYLDMRYRLLPLYYSLAHENFVTGLPIVRRLDILYPQYAEASRNDQYLLGENILVAPLNESFDKNEDYTFVANDGTPGLKGEYFKNENLEGTPAYVQYDERVYFDWEKGGPEKLGVTDNFSIRWEGKVNVGEKDLILRVAADDGIAVWIDGEKITAAVNEGDYTRPDGWDTYNQTYMSGILKAGTVHDIKIEYFESRYDAYIEVEGLNGAGASREVFLPDGEWMDIWTGKTYAGPGTITVTHGIETSPVFVRMGSVIALADNGKNTAETDWSHLTLDVYPSVSNGSSQTIYEDDTKTVGYKDGQFRTTEITLAPFGDGKSVELKINPAQGSFTGDLAFEERDYTLRIHGREGFGALNGVTLNGEPLSFKVIEKDTDGDPFANEGGSRDAVIYECTFKAGVYEESKLVIGFDSAAEDKVNTGYNNKAVDFSIKMNEKTKAQMNIDLDETGTKDWLTVDADDHNNSVSKENGNGLIYSFTKYGDSSAYQESYSLTYEDANGTKTENRAVLLRAGMSAVLKTGTEKNCYKLYVGGYKAIAKLTVRDRAGNVKTYDFGDMNANFYKEVIIECTSEQDSELYIEYSLVCGNNVTLAAVTAS